MESSPKRFLKFLIFVLLIVAVAFIWKTYRLSYAAPDANLYQVVLLRNDQAFYGKLHESFSPYPYLTDVYYLNPQKPVAPVSIPGRPLTLQQQKDLQNQVPKYTVVKRGIDEMHAPTDKLYFPKESVVYWENIGSDSLVARGIIADKDYRAKQAAQQIPAQTQPAQK
ncbi:MAG: hypothetical protein AAB606_01205 [Patescibacteria group bacterium]